MLIPEVRVRVACYDQPRLTSPWCLGLSLSSLSPVLVFVRPSTAENPLAWNLPPHCVAGLEVHRLQGIVAEVFFPLHTFRFPELVPDVLGDLAPLQLLLLALLDASSREVAFEHQGLVGVPFVESRHVSLPLESPGRHGELFLPEGRFQAELVVLFPPPCPRGAGPRRSRPCCRQTRRPRLGQTPAASRLHAVYLSLRGKLQPPRGWSRGCAQEK